MPPNIFQDADFLFGFARTQSYALAAQVYEIKYPDMDYASMVTVDTSIPEWAAGIDTLFGDITGEADWITGFAKDVPLADAALGMVSLPISMFGVGYQWNIEELGKAQFQNYPLTERRAGAARKASERFIWNRFLTGAAVKGWTGLLNKAGITPVALPADGTGGVTIWVDNAGVGKKTSDQIIRDLNLVLMGAPGPSRIVKNTILLPDKALDYLNATPYGVTSPGTSLIQYFIKNNEYTRRTNLPVTVRSLDQLKNLATVGVAGGGRIVAYLNSPDVMKLHIPMPFRFIEVHRNGPFNYQVPGMCRMAPLDITEANSVAYGDGVTEVP